MEVHASTVSFLTHYGFLLMDKYAMPLCIVAMESLLTSGVVGEFGGILHFINLV